MTIKITIPDADFWAAGESREFDADGFVEALRLALLEELTRQFPTASISVIITDMTNPQRWEGDPSILNACGDIFRTKVQEVLSSF